MYFNKILYSLIVIYSIGLAQNQVFASSLYFTAPPQGFGLSENNIGGYNAALDDWGPISTDLDALPGKFEEHKTNSEALQNPTPEEISVLTNLRQWLVDNRKGAATGWSTTTVGSQHDDAWVQPKVLRWGGTAAPFFFDGLRLPAGFNPKEYKILAFILSSQDAYNTSAMASSFNAKQGTQWNIQDSLGNKYTHKQNFFYSDHSGFSGQDPGILVNSNGGTDIHEAMHALGQGGMTKTHYVSVTLQCLNAGVTLI